MMNLSQDLIVLETHAYNKWKHLPDLDERFLRQRSKMHWLQVGNGNNRFFHLAAKNREVRNSIRSIKRHDGTIAETQSEIKIKVENYFHNFLTRTVPNFIGIEVDRLQELLGFNCAEEDCVLLTKVARGRD